MQIDVALCQIRPERGSADMNADRIANMVMSGVADVLVFPEMFLTGYGTSAFDQEDEIASCIMRISDICRKYDKAVAVGTPMFTGHGVTNSLAFLSPDGDTFYDKTHLAKFGVYSENGFVPGKRPALGSYHGLRFGLSICYDIYFPEVLHSCALRMSDVNLCISAAAVQSKPFFDRVLPARALENVTYLAFVNNVGPMAGLEMAGSSRALDPFGEEITSCGTEAECVQTFKVDTEALAEARRTRRHISDFRWDIDWLKRFRSVPIFIIGDWFPRSTSRDGPAR